MLFAMPQHTEGGDVHLPADSIPTGLQHDSLATDSLAADSLTARDTLRGRVNNFLDDAINGTTKDSIIYDAKSKMFYSYSEGDIKYQDKNLKADYIAIDMETKNVKAYGVFDSIKNLPTRPEFIDGGSSPIVMDSILYNLDTGKAKVKGVTTQQGEGFLKADVIKMQPDKTFHMHGGFYTTCDCPEPHFGFSISKAKLIPDNKMVFGWTNLFMEGVNIPFIGIPEGFFPITSGRKSGLIMPTFGEEYVKGFFLRDGGYYFAINDYIDLTATGGVYTLGSWEGAISSRYIKRYTYSGNLSFRYTKDIIGEKGDDDYVNMNNFQFTWSHTQDPKFRPNSTFSAQVNFSSSGYSKYGSNTVNDYLNTQTNSSIAYSKSWAGKPYSFSTNMQHSQNSRDTTVSLTFPSAVFNVSRLYPFKSKDFVGKEKWYHKISMSYTGNMTNTVRQHEDDLFTKKALEEMNSGIQHKIPIQASWNIFNYITLTPNATYTERWHFRKVEQNWDNSANEVVRDTTYGFYRLYDYTLSASMATTIYGMFQFKGKDPVVRAIRHELKPTIGFSYKPDFSDPKYGYYKSYQTDASGNVGTYSPYSGNQYGVPGAGESASITFGLQQSLEMKVRSQRDTTGSRKITLINDFSLRGSYNLLAESMKLSTISANFRTTIYRNYGINVSGTLDPYQVDDKGKRYDRLMIKDGKLARLTNASTSFSLSLPMNNSGGGGMQANQAMNNPNYSPDITPEENDFFNQQEIYDPATRRMLAASKYYDFNIPWNLSLSYSLSYANPGIKKTITQTMNANGSLTLTPKWGLSFSGGYDFQMKKITPGTINITRDLHCWQMNLSWVPIGMIKQWSFNISVKAATLRDFKYDRRNSRYDTLYD